MRILMSFVVIAVLGFSCKGNPESVQRDACREDTIVIPDFVQSLIDGGDWVTDTLFAGNNHVYYLAHEGYGSTFIIFDNERVWVEDPTLRVDSFASGCKNKFYVSVADKCRLIDFSDPASVRSLSSLTRKLPSFTRFRNDHAVASEYFYGLTVDYPQECVIHADEIRRWLADIITVSQSSDPKDRFCGNLSDPDEIIRHARNIYIDDCKRVYGNDEEEERLFVFSIMDMRVKMMNCRFVTYQRYKSDYEGGIHNYYSERLISFDHVHGQEIDFDYLFKRGCEKELLEILLDVAKEQHQYDDCDPNIEDYVYVTDNDGNRTGELQFPQPGLSDKGVVFSFQPYEIDCFAAGVFHYTIPYGRINHLFTEMGRWCVLAS